MPEYHVEIFEDRTYRMRVTAESASAAKDQVWAQLEDGAMPDDLAGAATCAEVELVYARELYDFEKEATK